MGKTVKLPEIRRLRDCCGNIVSVEPHGPAKGQRSYKFAICCRDPLHDDWRDMVLSRRKLRWLRDVLTAMLTETSP